LFCFVFVVAIVKFFFAKKRWEFENKKLSGQNRERMKKKINKK